MDQDKPAKRRGDAKPKIDFVLSLPLDMPAPEVSAKAKDAGLEIKPGYVHTIRSAAKKAKQGTATVATAAASTKSSKAAKTSLPKLSKAEFVLGLPLDMPATEVAAKAKAAGLELSTSYVYKIRSSAKPKTKPQANKAATKVEAKKKAKSPGVSKRRVALNAVAKKQPTVRVQKPGAQRRADAPSSEVVLRRLVLELGLKRSRDLLDEVETKLAALIDGK